MTGAVRVTDILKRNTVISSLTCPDQVVATDFLTRNTGNWPKSRYDTARHSNELPSPDNRFTIYTSMEDVSWR